MKKFILTVISVTVFFAGLGALIEKAGANFKSDARALEIINRARTAIGGEANINNVRSMTIVANTMHNIEKDGIVTAEPGAMEINFEMSGKFSKMVKIGNPADGGGTEDKQFDVVIVKKGDEKIEWKAKGEGNAATGDGKKIFVHKNDGSMSEVNAEGGKKIIVKKLDDDKAVFHTGDGAGVKDKHENVIIERKGGVPTSNELLRTVFALLLSAPDGVEAGYKYAGESSVDGFSVEVVEVLSHGSSFKLYLDKSSYLPRMVSFTGPEMTRIKMTRAPGQASGDERKTFVRKEETSGAVEHQIKFSDFRAVGGLLLPHLWTQTVGGKQNSTVDVTNFAINPADIADKFKNQHVMIRKEKKDQ